MRPPRVRTITFIPCNRLIYQTQDLGSIGLLLVLQSRPPDLALYEISVRRPGTLPARTPRPDIRLPSDSTSRWTPLPSANASCYRARSGLSPPSYRPCRAHKKIPTRHFSLVGITKYNLSIVLLKLPGTGCHPHYRS